MFEGTDEWTRFARASEELEPDAVEQLTFRQTCFSAETEARGNTYIRTGPCYAQECLQGKCHG
jgi:hypothetical protein